MTERCHLASRRSKEGGPLLEDSRPTTQDIEIEVTLKVGETVRGYLSEGYAGKQVIGKTEEAVRGDMKPQAPLYEIIIRRIE